MGISGSNTSAIGARYQMGVDGVSMRQIGTAVNVLLMLGSHDTRSAPFVLHTLKGGLLIVASIVGLLALVVGGR